MSAVLPARGRTSNQRTKGTNLSLTVVGSIAFDAVSTPFGERSKMLGGSAVHFSLAASFFTDVRVVGPVGEDFTATELAVLENLGVITEDIERVPGEQTFFWKGHYEYDLNTAHTDDTQLNVFGAFDPKLSEASSTADMLFLANIQPDLQRRVRAQCGGARFTAAELKPSRCPLLGYTPNKIEVEGRTIGSWFFEVDLQPEVGAAAYDRGAEILGEFFARELAAFRQPDLMPLGRQIIECCLKGGTLEDYEKLIPHGTLVDE